MPLDRDRIVKLLKLTQKGVEAEVIGCMKKINAMIEAEGQTWDDVLAGPEKSFKVSITRTYEEPGEDWVPPHLKDKIMIDTMFRAVYSQPRTGNEEFWQWLDSVHNAFQQYGQLTQGQYNGLRNSYRRAVRTSA